MKLYPIPSERDTPKKMIHLEGQELETGENAHAAFVRLRKPSISRTLWIGAISINQGELAERGNRVAQMRYISTDVLNGFWSGSGTLRGGQIQCGRSKHASSVSGIILLYG
jgi:hypothetical protein